MITEVQNKVEAFVSNMTPLKRGKVEKTLSVQFNYSGYGILTRSEFVFKSLQDDRQIGYFAENNGKISYGLIEKSGAYISCTKIEVEFALYLGMKINAMHPQQLAEKEARMCAIRRAYQSDVFYTVGGIQKSIDFYDRHIAAGHTLPSRMMKQYNDYKEYLELKTWVDNFKNSDNIL